MTAPWAEALATRSAATEKTAENSILKSTGLRVRKKISFKIPKKVDLAWFYSSQPPPDSYPTVSHAARNNLSTAYPA